MSPFLPRWNLGKPFPSQKVKEICTSVSHNYPEAWWRSPDLMQPFGTSCQARRWPHGWGEGAAALRLTSEMTLVREHRLVRKTDSSAWSHFPGEYRHEAGMCSGNYEVLWKIKMARWQDGKTSFGSGLLQPALKMSENEPLMWTEHSFVVVVQSRKKWVCSIPSVFPAILVWLARQFLFWIRDFIKKKKSY